jgi:ParB/RepB/Spo0J family partition protein
MITSDNEESGFNPGFPPGFDPERAEKGLAQEDKADEVDLPQSDEPTLEDALEHALTSHVEGAATRWLRLQRNGATDAELLARIADEFQGCGGSSQNGGWRVKGGKSPEFTWFDDGPLHKAQKLKGKRLLAKVREVLEIGAPGQPSAADKKRLHKEALARFRRGPQMPPWSPKCECGETEAQHDGPGGVCGLADCNCCGFTPALEDDPAPAAGESSSNGYHPRMLQMIPVDQIAPSPTNPRKHFDPVKLQELADSISEHGLIEPILVRPLRRTTTGALVGGDIGETLKAWPGLADNLYYEIVAGERRWRATKLAGLKEIEAKVRDLDDKAVLEIQFIENLQRSDLSAIEEAEGYKRLLDEHGYTAETLAGKLAKSKSYVYGRLKLCNLPPAALEALAKGELPATIGELIGRLPSMQMREEFWEENFDGIGGDWFEMPSFRDVKVEIERECMRELKGAPFPQNDKKLVPEAGSCKDCPKRTGNNKAEYPDARADICTDVTCFKLKVEAFNRRKLSEAAKGDGVRVLTDEESKEWFNWHHLADRTETRGYISLNEVCDEAPLPDDDEETMPTYGDLLGDALKVEVVGQSRDGQVHHLVSREAAEKILKEKGIKVASPARTESDRKASQQKHKEEKQIRDQAANEICDRVTQSLTDKPLTFGGRSDWDDLLRAMALHLVSDADIARFVAKRHQLGNGDHRAALHKLISDRSGQGTIELIVEYMLAEELEWWIRSGELPWPLKRFPICEYFGHDPKKIEKRIAKEHGAAKKAKAKPKAKAVATA